METTPTKKVSKYFGSGMARYLTRFLAGRTMFVLLLLSGVIMATVLVWQRAVSPLLDESHISLEQTIRVVKANTNDLQLVIDRRGERINHTPRSFTRFNKLFLGVTPTPTPSPTPSPTVNPAAG